MKKENKMIYCEICNDIEKCNYKEKYDEIKIKYYNVKYLKKWYECSNCGNIITDEFDNENVKNANTALRKMTDLITISEIEEILKKYNIGKKPLSLVLGLGEITITRYLDGLNPSKNNSDLLKAILNNPEIYEMYLLVNQKNISEVAYKKSMAATKQLILSTKKAKIYSVSLYILKKLNDITPLMLQKILYFVNGFSYHFLSSPLFEDVAMAWTHGPVYEDIYNCFLHYKSNNISYEEILKDYDFALSLDEIEYLNKTINYFGCYGGKTLENMSHLTSPWINARKGLENDEKSRREIPNDDIKNYFESVCKNYKIKTEKDILNYSKALFDKVMDY